MLEISYVSICDDINYFLKIKLCRVFIFAYHLNQILFVKYFELVRVRITFF